MHRSPRRAATLALLALAAMLAAAVLLESGQKPIGDALRAAAPMLGAAALPLLDVVLRLARGPDRGALGVGIGYSALVLLTFAIHVHSQLGGSSDEQMNIVFGLVFFWASAAWTAFLLVYLPALVWLLVSSVRAWRDAPPARRPFAPAVAWLVLAAAAWFARPDALARAADVREYRDSDAQYTIDLLYECLWRVAGPAAEGGFPDSLGAVRTVSKEFNGKPVYRCADRLDEARGSHPYDIAYAPTRRDSTGRARGFRLSTTERTRAGGVPAAFEVDEHGVLRRGVRLQPSRLDSARVVNAFTLRQALIVEHLVEQYAAARVDGRYPARVAYRRHPVADTTDLLRLEDIGSCSWFEHPEASCLEWQWRSIIYVPARDASGAVTGYTLTVPHALLTDNHSDDGDQFRAYYRDVTGAWHAFGGARDATEADPPTEADELARARVARDEWVETRRLDRERQARWLAHRDSAVHDSVARDSAARSSGPPGTH